MADRPAVLPATRRHLLAFAREPTHLVLLFVAPPVVVVTYGASMAALPSLPFLAAVPAVAGRMSGALFGTAFLAGLVGLFQVVSARRADRRVALCGYPATTLFATRLLSVGAIVLAAAVVSLAALWSTLPRAPGAPAIAFGALLLAGALYGLLGVLVGALVPRELEGSLVLVFVADLDAFLATGLVDLSVPTPLPLVHPHVVFERAVVDGVLASGAIVATLLYGSVLFGAATLAYRHATTGGSRS